MAQPLSGTVTVEDLYRLPLDGRHYELVEGNLLSEPLPGARHGRVAARDRYDAAGDAPTAFPGAPDLAVEVLSPADRPAEVHAKVADYLAAGTRLVWVIDAEPGRQSVTAYRKLLEPRILREGERLDGGDVLPGFAEPVSELF